jgi:hypothetical protein
MNPLQRDITVVRGNSGPKAGIIFRLQAGDPLEPIAYEDIRLSVYDKRGTTEILRATLGNGGIVVLDEPTGTIAWSPTAEESRSIPKSSDGVTPKATYELEVWNAGTELTYMMGGVIAIGGVNDDVESDS